MTNREVIAEIKKPGEIEVPVLTGADVVHLIVQKKDLLRTFEDCDLDAECQWRIYDMATEVRRLDVA